MFKRLFTLIVCTLIMSCNLGFLIVKAEEKPELYSIPIISNEINQKFIVGYLYGNELFVSVDGICKLTRSTCEISNQQVKIVQGIREIKIDLEQNKIKFGNQTTEFIVKRYNNKILVKPHAILNLLCANLNYNKINNSLFILMPSITIYEAMQPKLYSKCHYYIYDNDEFNTIVRMSASCFSDLVFDGYGNFFNKIPDILSFHGADSYIDNALIEISKVDIYSYNILEKSINNNLTKRTETIDSLKNISDYAENINSISSVYTDILKDVIGNSDIFLNALVKEISFTNDVVDWLSVAKSTEEKLNYNIDSFKLIGKVLTQQNIGEIQNSDTLIKRADFVSDTLSSKVSAYLNATEEQLENKLYDTTIKALAENTNMTNIGNSTPINELSLFLMAFDVGANVTKVLMKDEFQAWDSDINAIVISDIQNIMFDVIKQSYNMNESEGFSNYEHVKNLIDSINLYNRITIAMFSNLKKSNDEFHMYEKSFSDTWDSLCGESAENSYNLYSCNLERDICSLDEFKDNYNNDIAGLIDIESCEKYNDTLVVPVEDETQSSEPVEITEFPTSQISAIDLIDKTIPEIISLMNGEYQIIKTENDGYIYIQNQSVLSGMEFYISVSGDDIVSANNGEEIHSDTLKAKLESGELTLDGIQVNKSGKVTDSISVGMDYKSCSKALGDFDCIGGSGGYLSGSVECVSHTYNEKNAKVVLHFFDVPLKILSDLTSSKISSVSAEQMKSYNPKLCNVVVRKPETVTDVQTEPNEKIITIVPSGKISYYGGHRGAITNNGDLYIWGNNSDGQLGTVTDEFIKVYWDKNGISSSPIKIMENVACASLGYDTSAAITNDGSLYTWGCGRYGRLGNGDDNNSIEPVKIMDNVVSVSLGFESGAAITNDSSLFVWGYNLYGLGNGDSGPFKSPVKVMDNVKRVKLGGDNGAIITNDDVLYIWGSNIWGQLGNGETTDNMKSPVKVMDKVKDISFGDYYCAILSESGEIYVCGRIVTDKGVTGTASVPTKLEISQKVKEISCYGNTIYFIGEDDCLYEMVKYNLPVKIMENVDSISSNVAITKDGCMYTWGANEYGQLGNGTTENSEKPIKIMDNVMLS